ncbi:putative membrane protein [Candidatus Erwinia dacicola]|uniref:Membrane protein n=1 Tax=Candidatus Erwinia dacicola TaxID=252393 RepID=A0A328TPL9_9GAMM|nr:putative membrane protein [Candidatus Erwinia dacicola]
MNTSPAFLRLGTMLSCPAWLRMVLTLLLAALTWWAAV